MMQIRGLLFKRLTKICVSNLVKEQCRSVSALYVTGDKAKENTPPIQPYLDFEGTFENKELLEDSIRKRKLNINLDEVIKKYAVFNSYQDKLEAIAEQREMVAGKLKTLNSKESTNQSDVEQLKEQGKELRLKLKQLKQEFYPIDDEFVHQYLNLPNLLHKQCPTNSHERIVYVSPTKRMEDAESHLKNDRLILLLDHESYYMMDEAAIFDIECTHAFSDYIVINGDFIQTCNPDFARSVLLEANGTPLETYHKVLEKDLQNRLNPAYLVGGGAFESYLGDVTRLLVHRNVLPLRYAGYGRNYRKKQLRNVLSTPSLYTATQSNAVHTFVATETATEADVEMDKILNHAVDFYKELGIHFRIVYADASDLTISECLRADIQIYSPSEKRYIRVGHVSNYGDFVSKRILFTLQEHNEHTFLHLVGGPVLYTTRLIAALIEHGIALDKCKLLGHFDCDYDFDNTDVLGKPYDHEEEFKKRDIDVLKDAFK